MKNISTEMTGLDDLDLVHLLFNKGFDATLSFLCTLFVFSVD